MRPQDIEGLVSVGRPAIAPDGSFAVFATSRPDVAANRNVGQVWRVDLPDGGLRRLTRGTADLAPRLSPDAAAIAFLRADAKGVTQVFVVPALGGEPQQVTEARGGVTGFAWSPDGARVAFTARVPEEGRYGTVDGLEATAESPRRITGVRWHANGLGYALDRPAHVFIVDVPALDAEPRYTSAPRVGDTGGTSAVAAEAVQLTDGSASHSGIVFTPDGTAVLTQPDEIEPDARDLRSRIVAVPVDGGPAHEVLGLEAGLSVADVAVASDGAVLLLADDAGDSHVDFVAPMLGVWILESGVPRRLTDAAIDLGEAHLTVVGDDVLVQQRVRGRNDLLRIDRSGGVTVLRADAEVTAHAASADGTRIVASVATPDSLGELELISGTEVRVLTGFGEGLRDRIVRPREIEVAGRDGYPVHGWVAQPAGEGPFPVILQIHGGPYASYGIHLFDETQVLVDAGYAVVYCNPRGSAGYGRAHGRSIRQAMGTVDFDDVIDFLEGAVAADARLDGDRVGIMGGSYGGYLTAWVIAHDHRFAAAIVERGFLDPVSFQGTSDIGSFFGDEYVGVDPDRIAAQSPMAVVSQVTTPTLVVHSELDYRCPLEQATRYYAALRRQGTPAELLVFPGEDHELTRSGQPRHRIERFDAVREWWARHLPVA